jgi:predicted DNA-binding helix-hairpin-helix protein
METLAKLEAMAGQMHLEPAEEAGVVAPCGVPAAVQRKREALGIHHAVMPGGKTIPLLKTLLTSACERDCHYCPFRAGRNFRRTTFKPEEMATTFMSLHRAGIVEGLFLSSGIIKGSITTQDKLLDTVTILRQKLGFRGYVHLKLMPGAERAQIERAMRLSDRLSVNLEAPNPTRLAHLAPMKQFAAELLAPLRLVQEIRQNLPAYQGWNGRWPSTTTQFVVGAVGESDVELLSTTAFLYDQYRLSRAYYSSFYPHDDIPLATVPASPKARELRLYQASFLLRDYGFELESLPFDHAGNLPLDVDPKRALAAQTLTDNPVEINRASREELLMVPGIGPKSAGTILNARRQSTFRDLRDLQTLGLRTRPMEPYVLLDGRRPFRQLRLF